MIYILGMSHMRPVLDACSVNGMDEQLSKIANENAPQFADWDIAPGALPGPVKAASIYIRQIAPHWGAVPAQMTAPEVVGLVPGFQHFLESIDPRGPGDTLFVFMYGEEYLHMANGPYDVPHDFLLPWRADLALAPRRQVLPLEIVEKQVQWHLGRAIANFEAIRCFHPRLRIVNVICPPPDACAAASDPGMHAQRLKYYLLYVKALRAATERRGIETLLPPATALGADGALLAAYVDDGVHGNTAYGALVVAQMRDLLLQGAN